MESKISLLVICNENIQSRICKKKKKTLKKSIRAFQHYRNHIYKFRHKGNRAKYSPNSKTRVTEL